MDSVDLQARRERAFGRGARLFYRRPVEIVRGEGCRLFDACGRAYLDMYNNVPCVGHGNPHVAEAVFRQQSTLNVHSRYLHEEIIRLAERFCALYGGGIESVIFSCSGTEANEIAIRMARMATGRRGVIATNAAYHGNNDVVGGLSGRPAGEAGRDGVGAFAFPDAYRARRSHVDEARESFASLERAMACLDASGDGVAAIILCPIFANEGLPGVPGGYLGEIASRVRARRPRDL